jgi:hypothetical protein
VTLKATNANGFTATTTASVSYSLKNISDLAFWAAADPITGASDGTAIGTWSDLSGNANHATQALATNRPLFYANVLNNKPALKFNGNEWFDFVGSLFVGSDYTLIVVGARGTGARHSPFVGSGGGTDLNDLAFGFRPDTFSGFSGHDHFFMLAHYGSGNDAFADADEFTQKTFEY